MKRHFEDAEQELKKRLLYMGSLAEEMIHLALEALEQRTRKPLERLFQCETEVNHLQMEIDDRCLKLIALYQPTASDLRLVLAASKISSDLERVADQAVNIAQNAEQIFQEPQLAQKLLDIPRMAELAKTMIKDSLDAFVKGDIEMARSVILRDDAEDKMKSQAFHELLHLMQSDSSTIHRALALILIARNLERIADHATNIAEDVIFMACGQDVRHHAADESQEAAKSSLE